MAEIKDTNREAKFDAFGGKMNRTEFIKYLKELTFALENDWFYFMDLRKSEDAPHIFCNQHHGYLSVPMCAGADLQIPLFSETEEEKGE